MIHSSCISRTQFSPCKTRWMFIDERDTKHHAISSRDATKSHTQCCSCDIFYRHMHDEHVHCASICQHTRSTRFIPFLLLFTSHSSSCGMHFPPSACGLLCRFERMSAKHKPTMQLNTRPVWFFLRWMKVRFASNKRGRRSCRASGSHSTCIWSVSAIGWHRRHVICFSRAPIHFILITISASDSNKTT